MKKETIDESTMKQCSIVDKETFFVLYDTFIKAIASSSVDYVVFNIDASSSNANSEEIYVEISVCEKDKGNSVKTFLLPALKFHKFCNEEMISLAGPNMMYLSCYKEIYDISNVMSPKTISYSDWDREEEIRRNLMKILKEGKPSKKENKKSYCYYPKALNLHSKKFQRKYEEDVKGIAMEIIEYMRRSGGIKENEDEEKICKVSTVKEEDFDILTEVMVFKWNLVFQPYVNEMIKLYISEIEISSNSYNSNEKYKKFIERLYKYFNDDTLELSITLSKDFDDTFYDNWKTFLLLEKVSKCSFNIVNDGKEVYIELLKEKDYDNNSLNILLSSLLSDQKKIENIHYPKFDFTLLLPTEATVKYGFSVGLNIKNFKFDKEKKDDFFLSKISYAAMYLNNDNEEEILFGYQYETETYKLFDEIKNELKKGNKKGSKVVDPMFAKDIINFKLNDTFSLFISDYFRRFEIEENKSNDSVSNSYYTVKYETKNFPLCDDPQFEAGIEEIKKNFLKMSKERKIENVIKLEMGTTVYLTKLFEVADTKKIPLYTCNIDSKKKLLERLVRPELLSKVFLNDVVTLCKVKGINFTKMYHELRQNVKHVTKMLCYVINDARNKKEENCNCCDEKDKVIEVNKKSFDENYIEIVTVCKEEGNFWIKKILNEEISMQIIFETKEIKQSVQKKIANYISKK